MGSKKNLRKEKHVFFDPKVKKEMFGGRKQMCKRLKEKNWGQKKGVWGQKPTRGQKGDVGGQKKR